MADAEILPCPFCGCDACHAEQTGLFGPARYPWVVHCVDGRCPALPSVHGMTRQHAINRWNRRGHPWSLTGDLELLRKKIASDPDLETEAGVLHPEAPITSPQT